MKEKIDYQENDLTVNPEEKGILSKKEYIESCKKEATDAVCEFIDDFFKCYDAGEDDYGDYVFIGNPSLISDDNKYIPNPMGFIFIVGAGKKSAKETRYLLEKLRKIAEFTNDNKEK